MLVGGMTSPFLIEDIQERRRWSRNAMLRARMLKERDAEILSSSHERLASTALLLAYRVKNLPPDSRS
jgi:hypothetical protein